MGAFFGTVAAHPVQAITIAGAVTYAFVRASLARFYGRFGVDPEDVGLGYAEVLTRAVLGLAFGYAVLVVLGFLAIALGVGFAGEIGRSAEARAARWAGPTFKVWLVLALPVLGVLLPFRAEALGDDVVDGREVRPFRLEEYRAALSFGNAFGTGNNPFGIRAEVVEVEAAAPGTTSPLAACQCALIYLGRSDGIAVLYDATNGRTLRIPDSDVVIVRKS